MPMPDGTRLTGEYNWLVAEELARRSGEPVWSCLRAVERLGWEAVGCALGRVKATRPGPERGLGRGPAGSPVLRDPEP